jgi:uncharacterized protein YbaP (TraB family)
MLDRRHFIAATLAAPWFASLPSAAHAQAAGEPLLYRVTRGQGTAFILGYAEATNNAWFTAKIAAALDAADVLWLETPPGSAAAAAEGQAAAPDPEAQRVFAEQAFDRAHDLFEVLPPAIAERTLQWVGKLAIDREALVPMRPWFARITIQQAYASQRQATAAEGKKLVSPERAVVERARQRSIPIESEYATLGDLLRFFASLPDPAQGQYVQELLDYFDRDVAGENDRSKYGWTVGQPNPLSLDEQRERTPDLYRAMHIERNAWWTGRIEGLLAEGKTAFLMLGQNHTLGPDSVQANLARRGLRPEVL